MEAVMCCQPFKRWRVLSVLGRISQGFASVAVNGCFETIFTVVMGVGVSFSFCGMNSYSQPILLNGPMQFDRSRHSFYDFDCGQHHLNEMLAEIGDFSEIYPGMTERISVYTQGDHLAPVQPVIACASGKLVTVNARGYKLCLPRIDIELGGVDLGFQGLGLSSAVVGNVVQYLYDRAGQRNVELRMKEVVSAKARAMWERAGFNDVMDSDDNAPDMQLRLNPRILELLMQRWQPRLRPDMQIVPVQYSRATHG
jgi:hypothetical protein